MLNTQNGGRIAAMPAEMEFIPNNPDDYGEFVTLFETDFATFKHDVVGALYRIGVRVYADDSGANVYEYPEYNSYTYSTAEKTTVPDPSKHGKTTKLPAGESIEFPDIKRPDGTIGKVVISHFSDQT